MPTVLRSTPYALCRSHIPNGSVDLMFFAIRALAAALEGRIVYPHVRTSAARIKLSFTPVPVYLG